MEQERGFSISELAESTYGVSERTVRRCIEDLQKHNYIVQDEDGQYYPTVTLQSTQFAD